MKKYIYIGLLFVFMFNLGLAQNKLKIRDFKNINLVKYTLYNSSIADLYNDTLFSKFIDTTYIISNKSSTVVRKVYLKNIKGNIEIKIVLTDPFEYSQDKNEVLFSEAKIRHIIVYKKGNPVLYICEMGMFKEYKSNFYYHIDDNPFLRGD